jgi:hypothetical protein
MNLAHRPFKLLVTGRSGTGKTTYWSRYVTGARAQVKFIFDHQGEFQARFKSRAATTPAELAAAVPTGWCVYDPARMFPGRIPEAFGFFCAFAFEASRRIRGRKLFACDELQALIGTAAMPPELALVLETGRREELDAAMISQQPNLVHNRVRNQVTEVAAFAQTDQNAVGWLEAAGFQAHQVRALRPGECIVRNLGSGREVRARVF